MIKNKNSTSIRNNGNKSEIMGLTKFNGLHNTKRTLLLLGFTCLVFSQLESCAGQCSDYNSMGYCYDLVRNPMGWDDAQNYCTERGGRLVAIYNDSVQQALKSKLEAENYTGDFWTGGRLEEPNDWIGYPQSLWRWVRDCADCGLETACHGDIGNPLDLALVIDNSAGVTQQQINDMTNDFITRLLQPMTIGNNNVLVSILRMSDSSNPTLLLNPTRTEVLNAATQTSTSSSDRNLVSTLNLLRTQVFSGTASRANAPNVAVFLTAGRSVNSLTDITAAAKLAKEAGIRVYGVGVSNTVREDELKELTAPPKKLWDTYFMYNSTADLRNLYGMERVREKICIFHRLSLSLQSAATEQQGCFVDNSSPRDLPNPSTISAGSMEPNACRQYCYSNKFTFAATQDGNQCYCGYEAGSYNQEGATCSSNCAGNNAEKCGGPNSNSVYKINGTFSSWAFNNAQPNNLEKYQWCGAMDGDFSRKYDDRNCNNEYSYLCEMNDNSCTNPPTTEYFRLLGKCLYLSNTKDTWYRARNFCKKSGRNLFVMEDENQRQQLENYFVNVTKFTERFIFIGLNRNRFYWIDETGGTEMVSNTFGPKEPQPTDGQNPLKCVYVNPKIQHNWYTSSCAQNFSFVCHYRQPTAGPSSQVTQTVTLAPPLTAAPTGIAIVEGSVFPVWAIALLAALGGLLLLLLLLCLCCCCCPCCLLYGRFKKVWKVQDTPKVADARPKAPVPQKATVGKMDDINDTYSVSSSTAYMM